jgi:DNA-binding CsgD family transcriptional regulator
MNAQHSGAERIEPAAVEPAGIAVAYRNVLRHEDAADVQVVRGRQAVAQRFVQTQRIARREVLILDKPPYAPESASTHTLVRHDLLRRGVRFRTIYDREALAAPGRADSLRLLGASGEESRVFAGVPMKLVVADRRVGMVLLPPEDETVLLHGPALLDGLVALFELVWTQASPLSQRAGEPDGERRSSLTADDRYLLNLAAAGLTDHAVARKLGVAQRTVERRMRRIMDRLGARTRFQAGLQAAGWGVLATSSAGPAQSGEPGRRARR